MLMAYFGLGTAIGRPEANAQLDSRCMKSMTSPSLTDFEESLLIEYCG
jgi:hypothetical protein